MQIKDIENIPEKLKGFDEDINKLSSLFIALGFDYITYIDISVNQDKIYKLRDSILYRLFASRYHLDLLLQHLINSDSIFTQIYRKSLTNNAISLHQNEDIFIRQISALFDSLIFQLGSLFDYTSNLIEYCCSGRNNGNFKWTQLRKSFRGEGNPLSELPISKIIRKLDNEFVGKLYDHRSYVIHESISIPKSTLTINIKAAECTVTYIAPKTLTKRFSELKDLSKTYDLTLKYVLIWILDKTIESFEEIAFGVKETMEQTKKHDQGGFFYKDKNGEYLPPSTPYWRGYKKSNNR